MNHPNRDAPSEADALPLEPERREHGVSGYTSAAVGGFGEDYSHQVAQGRDSEPDTELGDANDVSLRRAVQKALARAHVDAAELRVEVRGARVTLYGTVQRTAEKSQLEALARAVPGVAAMTSRLSALRADPR